MKKLRNSLLWVLLTALCLSQTASDMVTPEIRRVGDRLACLCGSCKNTVATCQMLGCHYSSPAREKIAEMLKAGKPDEAIIDDFVKREGIRALAVPPAEGFNILAWVMPGAVMFAGFSVIIWWIRRNRKPPAAPEISKEELARFHEAAEKELSHFDE
jgi:cytochrome c-type biogenesis protein CcmH/NrfF